MKPALGWAGLSRSALRRAEAQLTADSQGVRDEIGVLALHTAYANRFFPGTSVQQTRLRYAVFIPWQIQALLRDEAKVAPGQARAALEQAEFQLAKRLPDIDGEGTIGRETVKKGRGVSIPPSQSYWVALSAWGILVNGPDGATPSRGELFSRWKQWPDGRVRRREIDDEKRALDPVPRLFRPDLPPPLRAFLGERPLDFVLRPDERAFLRKRLIETRRAFDGQPSFLASLARDEVVPGEGLRMWSKRLVRHADAADRKALVRAEHAAALSAVARSLYNAAVEALQDKRDQRQPGEKHRERLQAVLAEHAPSALRLDLNELPEDGVLIGGLQQVLSAVQAWIKGKRRDPLEQRVFEVMSSWELRRKGSRRAKLTCSTYGREARELWRAEETAEAVPINFRWDLIRTYLRDLAE